MVSIIIYIIFNLFFFFLLKATYYLNRQTDGQQMRMWACLCQFPIFEFLNFTIFD